MNILSHFKKIGIIYLSFWIIPIIIVFISIAINKKYPEGTIHSDKFLGFWPILIRNLTVYFSIFLLGFINKFLPYILYFYNSIIFTLLFSISIGEVGISASIIKVLPHGIIEILGFATVTYVGYNMKKRNLEGMRTKYLLSGLIFLIVAAYIESHFTPFIS